MSYAFRLDGLALVCAAELAPPEDRDPIAVASERILALQGPGGKLRLSLCRSLRQPNTIPDLPVLLIDRTSRHTLPTHASF